VGQALDTSLENRFPGVVRDVTFRGSLVHYEITVGDGRTVVAERPSNSAFRPAVGDSVEVGWRADASVVLPSPTSPSPSSATTDSEDSP
jgi:ABC-type Fe3+/spermidine/putrescine transport system ATPase subunit